MSTVIEQLHKKSLETYTYSDCDGGNNRGVRLSELKFAKLIIKECVKLNNQFEGKVSGGELETAYKNHFKISL